MNQSALLREALAPKSDQLNADDLIAGPITVRIRRVVVAPNGEQRISIFYDGDNDKPYKPGKSMGRVILEMWGDDPAKYIGRRLSLFRDPNVKMKGELVGGIRISHMSDIADETTMPLTDKRGSKKPYTVLPLGDAPALLTGIEIDDYIAKGKKEAKLGLDKLQAWWKSIGARVQNQIGGAAFLDELKGIASGAGGNDESIM